MTWYARVLRAVLAASVVGLPQAGTAMAQTRSVQGIVVDQSGEAVTGARVSTRDPHRASTMTDADGGFVLAVDAKAVTHVQVEKPRFEIAVVRVEPSLSLVRITLELEGVTEHVSVTSPLIDAASFDAFAATRTIVSASQVADLNAIDLSSALRRTPGVTVSRFNPVGSFGGAEGGAVFVRGTGASRPGSELKTYVDGAPFYMGIWDHPLLDLLPVGGMERLSVLKGPQPQSFGNTFSAIDLTTRSARADGVDGTARVSGGAFSTLVEQVDVAGRRGGWDFAAAQGLARSDGHREDGDGRLANVMGRVGYRWNEHWGVSGLVLYVDNDATDPGQMGRPETKTGRYATTGTLTSATLTHDHGRVSGSLQLYANRGEGNWFDQLGTEGDTLTTFGLAGLRWRESVALWGGGHLSAGVDVDRIDGEVTFDRVAPASDARFAGQALTVLSPHVAVDHTVVVASSWALTPSAGVRFYQHSEFDSEMAPHAGLLARHRSGLALRAAYARGVNYPGQEVVVLSTLIPPLGTTWRQLEAETMDHVELGAAVTPTSTTSIDVTYFNDRVENRYVFGFPPVVSSPMFTNLGAYRIQGSEITVQQRVGRAWQLFGGVTLLDPSIETLPYAPQAALVVGATGSFGRVRVSLDAQAQSEMYVLARGRTAAGAATDRVGGFTVVNLRPSYALPALGRRGELFVAIDNLLDADYAYRPGYPMPGMSAQVGVAIGFGAR